MNKNIAIIEQHTAQCCDKIWLCSSRHDALERLLTHIMRAHPEQYAKLKREGRVAARSQNGLGYYDSDGAKGPYNGWDRAQPTFRRAWIRKALDYALKQLALEQ